MSSRSNVEVPIYDKVTDINNIPYEQEVKTFTDFSISTQKRQLVRDALNHGLVLKAMDQTVTTQSQQFREQRRAQSQMAQRNTKQVGMKSQYYNNQNATSNFDLWSREKSLRSLRAKKEAIREHTMRRLDSMGYRAPAAWRDELYRVELQNLDLK